MAGLSFAYSHNMVAYLEKSTKNDDFAEIVDFLNANPIRFALTVSPTIYVSCIEQFWSTAKIKIVNNETQIHAKKLMLFMLAQQADMGEGPGQPTDPQHTSTSVQPSTKEPITVPSSSQPKKTQRPRKAKRATETATKEWKDRMERVATTASSLEAEQESGNINRTQSMTTLNEPIPQGTGSSSGPRCQDTILRDAKAQIRFEAAFKQSNDPPLSRVNTLRCGEDRLKLKELMELCTKMSDRVLDLKTTKTTQAKEIANLKKRDNKLEKRKRSRTLRMNLFKIERDFDDEGFDADMDEVFKDVEGDAKQLINYVAEEVSTGDAVNTAGAEVNTASAPVTTAGVYVTPAEPLTTVNINITIAKPITPPTTTTIVFEDKDLTIAQTLVKMKSEKSKVRGVVMQEPSETATRPTIPPQQHDPKEKGKGKMVEQENPLKKKDHIKSDEEIAQRLQAQMQAELEEEERLARQRVEDANITEWDDVQAMMDAYYELAARLQEEAFSRLRAEEQRRKPPTKAQKRNQMCTYLKNMAGFTHNQLKNKSFDEVQKAFDKTMSWIDSFVDMDSELVKGNDGDDVPIDATPFKMLKNFDRDDLEVLWRIVKARFKKTEPVDYMDTFLHLNLKTMFEHHVEDSI
ncbi:hypothetical protein Tco_0336097 [Tanacetum coccineum]